MPTVPPFNLFAMSYKEHKKNRALFCTRFHIKSITDKKTFVKEAKNGHVSILALLVKGLSCISAWAPRNREVHGS